MILVDTSVWVDHLRAGDAELAALLNGSEVLMHPCVLGELACGNLRNRTEVLVTLGGVTRFWTRDKRLRAVAGALALAYERD
ncbi:MAG: hypothetical protein B7Z66_14430 [Chromatiales bacterium 21-64-14]|nr:MAG: hypothetical protein B7Z66_14430 [Chromatiales bacterium 21-64-14]